MSLSPDSFHCREEEVLQVGLGDREVGAGQGGGGGRTVVKILSGYLSAVEHIRRLQDLNMQYRYITLQCHDRSLVTTLISSHKLINSISIILNLLLSSRVCLAVTSTVVQAKLVYGACCCMLFPLPATVPALLDSGPFGVAVRVAVRPSATPRRLPVHRFWMCKCIPCFSERFIKCKYISFHSRNPL